MLNHQPQDHPTRIGGTNLGYLIKTMVLKASPIVEELNIGKVWAMSFGVNMGMVVHIQIIHNNKNNNQIRINNHQPM